MKPGVLDEYKKYHAETWPGVLNAIKKNNIRNYSIFHKNGYLFSYFEYIGQDYEKDMANIAKDPDTIKWWQIMEPMQEPVTGRFPGEWWAAMEEVFHTD